jgi:hypothetical protein
MRMMAGIIFVIAQVSHLAAAPNEGPSAEQLFRQFDLFGTWATICAFPESATNPYVKITEPSPGVIMEEHHLGSEYSVNHYKILSAEKQSDTRLAVEVIFNPGEGDEERQTLVWEIRGKTRRTLSNQGDKGPLRVQEGAALPHGVTTPLLQKCK